MKKSYWQISLIWAIILYVLVCTVSIVIYGSDLIPHCGFQEYSSYEKIFMNSLLVIPMILTALAVKKDGIKNFLVSSGMFLLSSFILCNMVNIPEIFALYVEGYETFTHEVNWVRDDIWFNSYCGAFLGAIISGIVLVFRKCRQNKCIE